MDILSEYEYLYGDLIDFSKAEIALADIPYTEYRKKKSTNAVKPTEENKVQVQNTKVVKKELNGDYSDEARAVYSILSEKPTHIDDILRKTSLKMSDVLCAITELELMGDIKQTEGKNYSI